MVRHRAYDPNADAYVYWTAPAYDPNGDYYDKNSPSFANLKNIRTTESDVTTIQSVPERPGAKLLDGVSSTNSDPVGGGSGQGVDIAGFPTVNVYWVLSDASTTAKIKFWLWDGNLWVPEADDIKTLDNSDGRDILDPFDVEGGFSEMYCEMTESPPSGDLTVYVTPHN